MFLYDISKKHKLHNDIGNIFLSIKHVRFNEDITIHYLPICCENRKSRWIQDSIDRHRFNRRIKTFEITYQNMLRRRASNQGFFRIIACDKQQTRV